MVINETPNHMMNPQPPVAPPLLPDEFGDGDGEADSEAEEVSLPAAKKAVAWKQKAHNYYLWETSCECLAMTLPSSHEIMYSWFIKLSISIVLLHTSSIFSFCITLYKIILIHHFTH
ncbi:hypothetical protein A2U01_0000083 [Trifolium medium]|uniref:Uncharacterized protein n=1 Tax=Trifolium medium TaxID=97028 RepID=A0A392LWS6_9FABA|nr:hypothetical protein [Trifolium medium]